METFYYRPFGSPREVWKFILSDDGRGLTEFVASFSKENEAIMFLEYIKEYIEEQ